MIKKPHLTKILIWEFVGELKDFDGKKAAIEAF